jgi:hypothetical protein
LCVCVCVHVTPVRDPFAMASEDWAALENSGGGLWTQHKDESRVPKAAAADEWNVVSNLKKNANAAKQQAAVKDAAQRLAKEIAQLKKQQERKKEREEAKAKKKDTTGDRNLRKKEEEDAEFENLIKEQREERTANAALNRAKKNRLQANKIARTEEVVKEKYDVAEAGKGKGKGKKEKLFGKIDSAALQREFELRRKQERLERELDEQRKAAEAQKSEKFRQNAKADDQVSSKTGLCRRMIYATFSWLFFLIQVIATVLVLGVATAIIFVLLNDPSPTA